MADKPGGARLLQQARATLLQDLLPELKDDKRYLALMVANAMAIAARELDAEPENLEALRKDLELVLGPAQSQDHGEAVLELKGKMVRDLRSGRVDGNADLYDALMHDVRARLALSNPKLLDKDQH